MKSPHGSRERILLYGREGSGKTKAALDFARANDGTTYVVSNDNSIERLIECDYLDLDIELVNVTDWVEYRDALLDIYGKVDRDDLVIIDNMTWPWDEIKVWYVKEVYGQDMRDWAFEYRQNLDRPSDGSLPASLFGDYSYINSEWYGLHNKFLVQLNCHLILTANAKEVRMDSRGDKEVRDSYGQIGMAPDTQKRVGATTQTVVYLWSEPGGYYMSTKIKDRGREPRAVEKLAWDDFAVDYLERIALWGEETPAPVKKRRKV